METELLHKKNKLESLIRDMGSAVVAFSGGVDSALVLAVAHAVLGDKVLAVTARSESLPMRELDEARKLAQTIGVQHLVIHSEEMNSADYRSNPVNRCYFCKSELYAKLRSIADERRLNRVVNGVNLDDMGDYRPGLAAAEEAHIQSPLRDAGFGKKDIRALSRELGLPTWEKPAMACLSSRIPYGQPVTPEKLSMIERAEDFLISRGFRQVRVRHHGDIARVELPKEDIAKFFEGDLPGRVQSRFKEIGFKYVAVDIEGYRTGSLNETLPKTKTENDRLCGASN